MKAPSQKQLWWFVIAVFLGLCLWPIWSSRFPWMQDYPDQLFYADVLRLHNSPVSDYDRYYEFRLHPTYATFYLTTLAFAKLAPIEIAGKLSLSLYPILIAIVVLRLGRRFGKDKPPWGALLFFPFAFNQQYFYGNINYCFSLPILILALIDFEEFLAGSMRAWSIARQILWQMALVVTHPLSFAVFLALAVTGTLPTARRTRGVWSKLAVTLGTAVLVLGAVWLAERGTRLSKLPEFSGVEWLPLTQTLEFFALMFEGMQSFKDAQPATLILWSGALALLLAACLTAIRTRAPGPYARRGPILLGVAVLGLLALPFRIGDFSYLNVRLAAVVYFLAALFAAELPFKRWSACCLVVILGACLVDSVAKQERISAETNDIVDVVHSIPPRSRILPLVFDPSSPELDRFWFSPHNQDFSYYHLLVGGGFNPYLFGSPIDPVHPKPGMQRPAPSAFRAQDFSWRLHGSDYEYFLLLGAPSGVPEYMSLHCKRVRSCGKWTLFARRAE